MNKKRINSRVRKIGICGCTILVLMFLIGIFSTETALADWADDLGRGISAYQKRKQEEQMKQVGAIVVVGLLIIGGSLAIYYGNTKACPYCKGRIAPSATRCKHCGKDL